HFASSQIAEDKGHLKALEAVLQPWIDAHADKKLATYEYTIGAGFLRVVDTRFGEGRYLNLRDIYQDVVLLCDAVQGRRALYADMARIHPQAVQDGTLDRVVEELVASDILLAEGNYLLTLPVAKKPRTTEELRAYVLGQPEPGAPPAAPADTRQWTLHPVPA
ncbi:MAG: hypothetical protein HXX19_08125, partial [Rhodoferax sp.]|nr:hypothetical protein [Rhodoferax sp.]